MEQKECKSEIYTVATDRSKFALNVSVTDPQIGQFLFGFEQEIQENQVFFAVTVQVGRRG